MEELYGAMAELGVFYMWSSAEAFRDRSRRIVPFNEG